MRLAVKTEAAEKQHGDILRRDAEPLAPALAQCRRRRVGVVIDPERDDRQLRQAAPHRAEPGFEINGLRLQHAIDDLAHRAAGADHRVPRLHRRDQPISDDLDHCAGDDRVGDPDQAVGLLVVPPPQPGELVDADRRVEQAARLLQPLRLGERDPAGRDRRAMRLGARGKFPVFRLIAGIAIQPVGAAMAHETAQEAFAGGMPAHQPRTAGVERIPREIDRRVGPQHPPNHCSAPHNIPTTAPLMQVASVPDRIERGPSATISARRCISSSAISRRRC